VPDGLLLAVHGYTRAPGGPWSFDAQNKFWRKNSGQGFLSDAFIPGRLDVFATAIERVLHALPEFTGYVTRYTNFPKEIAAGFQPGSSFRGLGFSIQQ
jgi:hypothetical protein